MKNSILVGSVLVHPAKDLLLNKTKYKWENKRRKSNNFSKICSKKIQFFFPNFFFLIFFSKSWKIEARNSGDYELWNHKMWGYSVYLFHLRTSLKQSMKVASIEWIFDLRMFLGTAKNFFKSKIIRKSNTPSFLKYVNWK